MKAHIWPVRVWAETYSGDFFPAVMTRAYDDFVMLGFLMPGEFPNCPKIKLMQPWPADKVFPVI
jgi:hypothetical protein